MNGVVRHWVGAEKKRGPEADPGEEILGDDGRKVSGYIFAKMQEFR